MRNLLLPHAHVPVPGDIFKTAQYSGSFKQDFLHCIFQDSPKSTRCYLSPDTFQSMHEYINSPTDLTHKTIKEKKKKSRPLNLAHQWILISIDTHLTCKSTGSLTQTFCVVTWWDVASYLDTTVFPALPLLCRQSSAPKKKRHNPSPPKQRYQSAGQLHWCDCVAQQHGICQKNHPMLPFIAK